MTRQGEIVSQEHRTAKLLYELHGRTTEQVSEMLEYAKQVITDTFIELDGMETTEEGIRSALQELYRSTIPASFGLPELPMVN